MRGREDRRRPAVPTSIPAAVAGAVRMPIAAAVGAAGRPTAVGIAVLLAAALVPAPGAAQEDPLDRAPGFEPGEGETGWTGNADFGFTLTEGNSETTNLSLAGRVVWRWERSRWTGGLNFLRATDDGEETANRGEASLQYDYFPSRRVFFFGGTSASFNDPAGLDLRLSPSAGVGYQALEEESLALTVQAGGSWIRDAFADGTSEEAVHAVLSEAFSLSLGETADLQQSLAYEPKVEDLADFLLRAEVSVSAMITDAVGLKVSLRDEFDSRPFDPAEGETREKNDITFVTGVTYRF